MKAIIIDNTKYPVIHIEELPKGMRAIDSEPWLKEKGYDPKWCWIMCVEGDRIPVYYDGSEIPYMLPL